MVLHNIYLFYLNPYFDIVSEYGFFKFILNLIDKKTLALYYINRNYY